MNREAFLQRIQQAAEAGRCYRVTDSDQRDDVGYVGVKGPLHDVFATEVQANGGVARVVDTVEAARQAVVSLVQQHSATAAICWQHRLLDRLNIGQLLAGRNVACHDFDSLSQLTVEEQRRTMLSAEVGITSVDLAVAETGSLVVCSRPGQERVASLLPPCHIAVVEQSQIVPDLFDVFEKLEERRENGLPRNLVFISGPSKTGDIAMQMTTGVHGPGHWHVVVLAEVVG